jgi:hypothetical protein
MAPASLGYFTAISHLPSAVAKVDAGFDLFSKSGLDAKLTYKGRIAQGYWAHAIVGRLTYNF